ncbi:hypothetical protein DPMN_108514 [Dreissena polymorpha]|uniref:Uncharacterized protein n=1 Tax=Dreissena polymorpha TaxID=45954 RepID=A0A9D4K987_DREPO|nr:hypothetical protein DPMN_108514 [Dreissena polymorpha]
MNKCHTKRYPIRGGLPVYPEGDPGEYHEEAARNIHVDEEEAHVPAQVELDRQNGVGS